MAGCLGWVELPHLPAHRSPRLREAEQGKKFKWSLAAQLLPSPHTGPDNLINISPTLSALSQWTISPRCQPCYPSQSWSPGPRLGPARQECGGLVTPRHSAQPNIFSSNTEYFWCECRPVLHQCSPTKQFPVSPRNYPNLRGKS